MKRTTSAREPASSGTPPRRTTLRDRVRGKRPVFVFVGLFALLMALFYVVTTLSLVNETAIPKYMRYNARASAALLNLFGEGATANGTSVSSRRYSVDIRHGCDAIEPSALFIAAVVAFPSTLRSKIPGLIAGTVVLAVINLVRIVSLFYTGIHFPRAFEIMHVDVWQPVFILLALTLWVVWALWATRRGVGLDRIAER
jgi:exosortase H (IPTLxxWG-CTERM-specific)